MRRPEQTLVDVLVLLALGAYAVPFFWQLLTSFKPETELLRVPPLLPSRLTLAHYSVVLEQSLIPRALVNSVGIATLTTLLALAVGVPGAYAIARGSKPSSRRTSRARPAPPMRPPRRSRRGWRAPATPTAGSRSTRDSMR